MIGDQIITANINESKAEPKVNERRCWKNYTKEKLENLLSEINFETDIDDVQEMYNVMEHKLLTVIDNLIPITAFTNNQTAASNITPTKEITVSFSQCFKNLLNMEGRKCIIRKTTSNKQKSNPNQNVNVQVSNTIVQIVQF